MAVRSQVLGWNLFCKMDICKMDILSNHFLNIYVFLYPKTSVSVNDTLQRFFVQSVLDNIASHNWLSAKNKWLNVFSCRTNHIPFQGQGILWKNIISEGLKGLLLYDIADICIPPAKIACTRYHVKVLVLIWEDSQGSTPPWGVIGNWWLVRRQESLSLRECVPDGMPMVDGQTSAHTWSTLNRFR